ncbi:HtrA protease/chaperone protein [Cystobacter fuscus DSM 2262]|uniref:HtrA protease/chaperone protein n=2 Tax=Cystobacter fuscus TaxID=43 RepID=S9NUP4_CYSF2|nr:trypsin-like peptidase domain-containing protein [Cystobacter fuscus]EPX55920.1 HtrA protease/chaperone protein [Cystobacter fuscus DSM 2262]
MSSPSSSRHAMRGVLFPLMMMASACHALGATPPAPPPAAPPAATAAAPVIPSVTVPSPGSLAPLVEAVKGAVVNVEVLARAPVAATRGMLRLPPGWAEQFGLPDSPQGGARGPVQQGQGSGFIVDAKGLVLTNNHVVENAERVRVKLDDGRAFDAQVLGRDPLTDVAVLQLQNAPRDLPHVALGDSDAVRVGDFVLAIGNPFGLASSVSSGILSARARDIHAGPYDDFLQTDAAINPGNSGGPLFNLKGEVIGMNTAIVREATGIGFAVPSNLIHSLLPRLEKDGVVRRGWLGLAAQDLTPDLARALGLEVDKGAIIADVNDGGPGARAGLQDNDVITRVEDTPIVSAGSLTRAVGLLRPDSRVSVHVLRDGKPLALQVTLGTRPAQRGEPEVPSREEENAPAKGRLGMRLADDPQGQGVRVVRVDPGSPAEQAELPPGSLLRQVGDQKVANTQEAAEALRSARPGSMLLLRIQPPGSDVTLLRALPVPS